MRESKRPARILIVDDEAAIRKLLDQALRDRGFVVYAASSGIEAVELLRRHRPAIAVAVIDVIMPEMDGPATLRALRAVQPELPACFFTGHAGRYADSDLLAQGSCAVLNKPCPLEMLAATLNRLIEGDES